MSQSVIPLIDHAVLQPTANDADVRDACALCDRLGVASVCVKPSHVPLAAQLLSGSGVLTSTVIGFPHGGTSTVAKVAETHAAGEHGAREVDMVVNLGMVLSGDWSYVEDEIRAVVKAAAQHDAITKVIFETGLLPNDHLKQTLCKISEAVDAAFVKTSTGFGYVKGPDRNLMITGATTHDVRLLRKTCTPAVGVKASGGIRTLADAQKFIALGATRIGTSATAAIAEAEQATAPSGSH